MRYFAYIIGTVILFSGLCAYFLFYQPRGDNSTAAIIINERVISQTELRRSLDDRPAYQSRQAAVEQLISRELLIQEAMERGLHQQEIFRQRIRAFYEKSLIQSLMEEKTQEMDNKTIDPKLLENYKKSMSTCLTLRRQIIDDSITLQIIDDPITNNLHFIRFIFLYNRYNNIS